METILPEITGRSICDHLPLAITVKRASQLSGLGLTSIWAFLRDGRLEAVRVPGVRRTLISYASLSRLLCPRSTLAPASGKRGHPRKQPARGATA